MSSDSIILERRFVPAGAIVMREGDDGNSAYLIQSGSVLVYTEHEGKTVTLAELDMGQIFGEMALIFDEPRSASVRATEDCNLIVLTRDTLKQKLQRSDPTVQAIMKMLTERMVTANNAMIKKKTDLADLNDTVRIIYENVLSGLPRQHQRTFQNAILPKIDDLLNAVRAFEAKINEEGSG